jgi:signal transduction histidine kinase
MKILRVLLVDDDPKFLDFAGGTLTSAKYSVSSVSDFEAAAAALDDFRGKAVVLSDLNVKRQSALVFLRESHKKYGHVPFTILAQSPSLESVIEALKQGAYDFLRKPVSPDILRHSVARSVEKMNLTLEAEKQDNETRRLLERSRAEVERVKNISSFKGFLISTTAHDFNSTLTVLDGYNHFLKERCKECREPGATNLREQTQRSITRLRAMTATLMDYEAAERGELRLTSKKFDLTALLKDCVTFYKPYAEQKQVDMGLEEQLPSLTVHGDPARVMQVMDNLLYNAVKFTPSKGEIRVGAKPEGEGVATVWVRDTGVGIPRKIQDKIFGESVSVSDEDGSSRMGLGLSICRKLIEAQNGKIWLESTQGKGTVVSFSLPRQ